MKFRANIDLKFDRKDWLYFIVMLILIALILNGDLKEAVAFIVKVFSK